MMKTLKDLLQATVLASLVSLPAFAGGTISGSPGTPGSLATAAFAAEAGVTDNIDLLSEREMSETKGELAFLVAAIVGVDLALIGAFWGVYVPNAGAGTCLNCNLSDIKRY